MQLPPWMDGSDPADKLNVFLLNTARLALLGTPSFMRTLLHMAMACIRTGLRRPVTYQWAALQLNPSGGMTPCNKVFKVVTVCYPTFPLSLSLPRGSTSSSGPSLPIPVLSPPHPCFSLNHSADLRLVKSSSICNWRADDGRPTDHSGPLAWTCFLGTTSN